MTTRQFRANQQLALENEARTEVPFDREFFHTHFGASFQAITAPILGLVVGAALALNTVAAVCLGGAIPLLLRKLRQDPALASGPILTTITDMCGFFFVLSFARAALPWLLGS